jgi:hypothetical protein
VGRRLHHQLRQAAREDRDRRTSVPTGYESERTNNGLRATNRQLHGPFPSQSPFIISEEDYRTYPRRFAPFVNSVQQSLLENSFVLIGFSGDDPNFLEWTGWIRDELGGKHAPIYLVGPLSLGNPERSLLTGRGVTPIDLSPILTGIRPADDVHAASIEWFLNSLWAARPPRPETWPRLERISVSAPDGLPPLVDGSLAEPERIGLPTGASVSTRDVARVTKRWKFERQNYPGWVVAPEEKRSKVWDATKIWIQPLMSFSKDWPAVDRILLLREVNWRLETSMVPLFTDWIEPFQTALDELFDGLAAGQSIRPSVDFIQTGKAPNAEIIDAWVEIALALLRQARETYDADRWNALKGRADAIVRHRPKHADRNWYEAALWALWNVERVAAKTILSQWHPSVGSPLAAMWKAGLLAELDDPGEARTILRLALSEIRRALRTQGRNIELLSLEGWCTYLLHFVESSLAFTRLDVAVDEFSERWQELKAWDCDPWPYRQYLDEALSASPPKPHKHKQQVRGFDPGRVTVSVHLSSDPIRQYLPGFACIRLYEQVGIPLRMPMFDLAGQALTTACSWVAPFNSFWSPALLIRAGKLNDFTDAGFLSRTQLAAMDPVLARRLYAWCLQILERELTNLSGPIVTGSARSSLLAVLPEVLSRLAFKADVNELRRTFPLVLHFHNLPEVRSHVNLHEACEPWFRRLFHAADGELLLEWLPSLLKAPLFDGDVNFPVPAHQASPDPTGYFPGNRSQESAAAHGDLVAKVNNAADWLLKRASSPYFSQVFRCNDVAQALVPVASALMPTLRSGTVSARRTRVEKSLDAAGSSACATSTGGL